MRLLLVPVAIALLSQTATAPACAFCSPTSRFPSLQKRLDESVHAMLARTSSANEPKITRVLKSPGDFEVGQTVTVGKATQLASDTTWLVVFGKDVTQPHFSKLTPKAAEFARRFAELPAVKQGDTKTELTRLAFFFSEFGNRDKMVAASVSHAFAKAPYETVKLLKPHLDAKQIEAFLLDASPDHRGILYLMLAIEGSPRARQSIATMIGETESRNRAGFDGLIGGFLLFEGKKGLDAVLATRPSTSAAIGARIWFAKCLLRALEFHLVSESVLTKADIWAATHSLFDDPYAAGPAVGLLVEHKHWDSMEEVLALHAKWGNERPSIDRATKAFLIACGSQAAKEHLEALRAK